MVTGRRYLDMSELEEQRHGERESEEVTLMKRQRKDQAWRKLQKLQDLTLSRNHHRKKLVNRWPL